VANKQTVIIPIVIVIFATVSYVIMMPPLGNESHLISSSIKPLTNAQASKCHGTALCISDKIEHIIDGDTMDLESGHRVRISLTNTPEIYQKGYSEATQFTTNLCPIGSTVLVDQDDMQPYDKFNRLVGKVICQDKVLNAELLYNAHANILVQYCSTSEFADEQWATKYGC